MSPSYQETIIPLIKKSLFDEISAGSGYLLLFARNLDYSKRSAAHAAQEIAVEEFEHFGEISELCNKKGFIDATWIQTLDKNVVNFDPRNKNLLQVVEFLKDLEKKAYDDYIQIARIAAQYGDNETADLFFEIAEDERIHYNTFDDLLNCDSREMRNSLYSLNCSPYEDTLRKLIKQQRG